MRACVKRGRREGSARGGRALRLASGSAGGRWALAPAGAGRAARVCGGWAPQRAGGRAEGAGGRRIARGSGREAGRLARGPGAVRRLGLVTRVAVRRWRVALLVAWGRGPGGLAGAARFAGLGFALVRLLGRSRGHGARNVSRGICILPPVNGLRARYYDVLPFGGVDFGVSGAAGNTT